MKLLTDELKQRLPALYSQEEVADPTVQVLLCGANGWIWALTEYSDVAPDGCPELAFGWVAGDCPELGYVSIAELDEVNAPCLPDCGYVWVKQDFVPCPLSEVQAKAEEWQQTLREELESGVHVVARRMA